MPSFSKSLLTIVWFLLLLAGTGNANRPVFSPESDRDLGIQPPPLSVLSQPFALHSIFNTPPEHVSIANLLSNGADYHQRFVAVRGLVTQPELHPDESELLLNFVFRLADGDQSIVVFGQHDRTQGAPIISLNLSVEVIGVFWKERDLHGSAITNTIEAVKVTPYPSLIPENA